MDQHDHPDLPTGAGRDSGYFSGILPMINGRTYLNFGFSIDDNESITSAHYLSGWDSILIDFVDDHDGTFYLLELIV